MQNKIEDIEKRIKKIKDIIKANESVVNQIKDEKYMSKKETAQKHSIDDLVDKNMDFDFINELKKTIAINNKLRLVFIGFIILSSILIIGTVARIFIPETIYETVYETTEEYDNVSNKLNTSKVEITKLEAKIKKIDSVFSSSKNQIKYLENKIIELQNNQNQENSSATDISSGKVIEQNNISSTGETIKEDIKNTVISTGEVNKEEKNDTIIATEETEIITETKTEEETIVENNNQICIGSSIITRAINVRQTPGKDGKRISMFNEGIKVNVINFKKINGGTWFEVTTEQNFTGWISNYALGNYDINNCINK